MVITKPVVLKVCSSRDKVVSISGLHVGGKLGQPPAENCKIFRGRDDDNHKRNLSFALTAYQFAFQKESHSEYVFMMHCTLASLK